MKSNNHHEKTASANLQLATASRFRIVDAMFVDDTRRTSTNHETGTTSTSKTTVDEYDTLHQQQPTKKRRKLTLLDTSTAENTAAETTETTSTSPLHALMLDRNNKTKQQQNKQKQKSKQPIKILDPLTRIVDDSLQEVLVGAKTIESHYQLLFRDPRFTLQDITLQRKWLTWSCQESNSNILHCCALWNDPITTNQILQYCSTAAGNGGNVQSKLVEATDVDGRTPYEIAQLIGHEQVCQVLEAYGGDTSNYVYDIFYLDDDVDDDDNDKTTTKNADDDVSKINHHHRADEKDSMGNNIGNGHDIADGNEEDRGINNMAMMTAELTSGVGYWTPDGELILEADEKFTRSLSHETDGDIDSNCEEFGANDYPDEDDDDDADYQHNKLHWHDDDHDSYNDDDDDDEVGVSNNGQSYDIQDQYVEYDWEEDLEHEDHRHHYRHQYDYYD